MQENVFENVFCKMQTTTTEYKLTCFKDLDVYWNTHLIGAPMNQT